MTTGNPSSASLWSGRVLTALVTLFMIADAAVDIFAARFKQVHYLRPKFVKRRIASSKPVRTTRFQFEQCLNVPGNSFRNVDPTGQAVRFHEGLGAFSGISAIPTKP